MAEHFLGGQSLGQPAVIESRATPANPGANTDLAVGPCGLAGNQLSADRGQRAKDGVAQPVAQKLSSSGAGIWKMSIHVLAIDMNFLHFPAPGLPFFVQPLTFLSCLIAAATAPKRPNKSGG
jgi:hypothetical protein